jgi:hypothetical protein
LIETCTGEKLPRARTPAVSNFEKFPAFEEYESHGLLGELAANPGNRLEKLSETGPGNTVSGSTTAN